jgi:hypothetical protein
VDEPGHRATLTLPDIPGVARLSFSKAKACAHLLGPLEEAKNGTSAHSSMTDLTSYPARRGFEDLTIVYADPALAFAWVAVTVADEGYVWGALKKPDPAGLNITLVFKRRASLSLWNGQHVNVLSVEDMTAFFPRGARHLLLEESPYKVRTYLEPGLTAVSRFLTPKAWRAFGRILTAWRTLSRLRGAWCYMRSRGRWRSHSVGWTFWAWDGCRDSISRESGAERRNLGLPSRLQQSKDGDVTWGTQHGGHI